MLEKVFGKLVGYVVWSCLMVTVTACTAKTVKKTIDFFKVDNKGKDVKPDGAGTNGR